MSSATQVAASGGESPVASRPSTAAYAVSAILLLSAFVALLWVPSYAHLTPSLLGLPFFYWYSLLWLVLNALFQGIAYELLVAGPRRRRSRLAGHPNSAKGGLSA